MWYILLLLALFLRSLIYPVFLYYFLALIIVLLVSYPTNIHLVVVVLNLSPDLDHESP